MITAKPGNVKLQNRRTEKCKTEKGRNVEKAQCDLYFTLTLLFPFTFITSSLSRFIGFTFFGFTFFGFSV